MVLFAALAISLVVLNLILPPLHFLLLQLVLPQQRIVLLHVGPDLSPLLLDVPLKATYLLPQRLKFLCLRLACLLQAPSLGHQLVRLSTRHFLPL